MSSTTTQIVIQGKDEFSSVANTAAANMARIGGSAKQVADELSFLRNAASAAFASLGGAQLAAMASQFLSTASAMETLEVSLRTVTGSSGAAKQSLAWITEFAAKTPYQVMEIADAFRKLSAYGLDAAKNLPMLGDAASSMGKSLNDAVEMFADAATGEFERLKEFGVRAEQTGNNVAFAWSENGKAMTIETEKNSAAITAALSGIFDRFAGGMEAQSKTWAGMMSTMSDQWEQFKLMVMDDGPFEEFKRYASQMQVHFNSEVGKMQMADWARSVKSEIYDIMQIGTSLGIVLNTAAQAASAVGMGVYGPGAALGIENSERGFEYFAASYQKYQEQIAAGQSELNRLISEQERIQTSAVKSAVAGAEAQVAAGEKTITVTKAQTDAYEKYVQTREQALRKEAALAMEGAKTPEERAKVEAKLNEEIKKLHESEAKSYADSQKKQTAELEKHIKERNELYAKQADGVKNIEIQFLEGKKSAEERALDIVNDRIDAELAAEEKALQDMEDARAKALEKQQEESQKVIDNITESTADVFYDMFQNVDDGWATLWEGMKNYALKALAQIAAQAATTQIVVPVLMAATGAGSGVDAVTSITGGNGLSGLSNLAGLGNSSLLQNLPGYGYVSGLLATQLPGTVALSGGALSLAAGGTAGGAVASLAAAQNLAGMTGGLSIGSALGMGSLGGLGYSLLGGALGLQQNQYTGITSSLGGALGAWGGTALAGSAGAALGATAGSVVPIVGTAVGAILGGLAGSLFGGDEQSPSVIFQKQQTGWGQTTGLQYHTKDGGSNETGDQLSAVLGQYMGTVFDSVEASLGTVGDEYVAMLDDAVIEWGRKAGGSWKEWDFGSDMNIEDLIAKAQADLKAEIYEAAAGAFTAAGQAIASDTDTTSALAMLSGKAAESMQTLLDAIRTGVQSGDVEAYAAQLQTLKAAIGGITAAWESVSQASAEMVDPLTQYEQAQRAINQQYDGWIAQLDALGFATEKVSEIEADRVQVLANLAAENQRSIDAVLRASGQAASPLSEFAAAQQRINDQFDDWIDQLVGLSATQSQIAQVEADRATALASLAEAGFDADKAIEDLAKAMDKAVSDVQSALTSLSSTVRSNLINAYNSEKSAISDALSGVLDGLKLEIDGLTDAMSAANDAADAWRSVSDTLRNTDIIPMTLQQAMSSMDAMIAGAFRGQAPDSGDLGRVVGVLSGIDTRDYATRADFDAARGGAAAKIDTLAAIAGTQISAADRQLALMEDQRAVVELQIQAAQSQADAELAKLDLVYQNAIKQLDTLDGIKVFSGSMDNALAAVVSLTRTYGDANNSIATAQLSLSNGSLDAQRAAVTELQRIAALLSSVQANDIPGYATGGHFGGGLRIVGENGPELEMTGPSRIWSANDTRAMLSGGGSDAAEIRALREDLRAQSRAMVAMQQRMTKLLERWNIDGMPEVRTA